jgi:hypothetical protein
LHAVLKRRAIRSSRLAIETAPSIFSRCAPRYDDHQRSVALRPNALFLLDPINDALCVVKFGVRSERIQFPV